ncbi:MAG: hypothetical protein JWN79_2912 [Gemmatimonadetes bacterium]|nr:hypothetical protein [Gemmatimonadota bacterium]
MTAPPPTPRAERSAGDHLRAALTEHLGLKAIALVLAVLLWVVVGARTPTEGWLTAQVEPTLDSSLVLLDAPPRVRVLVSARTADLVKLHAAPPVVRRTISGDAPDTLMLDIAAADVRFPPELSRDVQVLDVQPRRVMLRLERRVAHARPARGRGP